jgi:DNA-binding MarR family transcriptional regulator
MADVAAHLHLDKSTVTGIVSQGERLGLMRRLADPSDGRAVLVELTDAGHELARACEAEVAHSVGPLVGELRARL